MPAFAPKIPSHQLGKLEAILASSETPKALSLPIFARLFSIDQTEFPPSELSSSRQQGICRRVLLDWLHQFCATNPVLILFEDVQWIDPSSATSWMALSRRRRHTGCSCWSPVDKTYR